MIKTFMHTLIKCADQISSGYQKVSYH